MTSHRRRDNDHSMFTTKTPHFFKVILPEAIGDGKLGIPWSFVRKHGKLLSSPIQLEVPSGAIWRVELTKCDEGLWLQKGWQEFVEHYSLKCGYFVVFRYDANVHFRVFIFDRSASEIDYPCTRSTADDDMSVEVCENVPASSKSKEKSHLQCPHVEVCENVPASSKSKEKSHLQCPRPCKKIRTDSDNEIGTNLKLMVSSSSSSPHDPKSGRIKLENLKKVESSYCTAGKLDVPSPATKGVAGIASQRNVATEVFSCMQRLTPAERARAIQTASAFKRTENPVFMVVMKPSFIGSKYRLVIPWNFARKFLTPLKGNLTLCDSTGKTWCANYFHYAEYKRPIALLYGGWRAFAEDNNLKVGDICVFELIKHPEILMKVAIYPVVENASKACRPVENGRIARRVNERSSVNDAEPSFPRKKTRTDSANQVGTNLELKVSSSSISSATIKLGNIKKVENSHCSTGQLGATKGAGGFTARTKEVTEVLRCVQPLTDTERAHAVQIASAFKSTENPVFMVVMKPSFIRPKYRMVIPLNFARKFLTRQKGNLTLWDSTGKIWRAKYCHTAEHKKPKAFINGGWRAFAVDKNLNVGDICVFELIKHPEILMKVVIYPVVENASKVCRPLANGSLASQIKTRRLVSHTEPNFRQRQCPPSSREFKDSKIEPCKMMRTNPSSSFQAAEIKLEKQKNVNFQSLTKELKGEFNCSAKDDSGGMAGTRRCLKPELMSKLQPLTPTYNKSACIRASAFKSSNPSFTVVMQPSYVSSGAPVHIPNQFAKRYLKKNGEVILRVSDGRTWIVDYQRKGRTAATILLRNSWKAFMLDNNLKVGDICVFELIKENGITLKVVVLSAADIASCSS